MRPGRLRRRKFPGRRTAPLGNPQVSAFPGASAWRRGRVPERAPGRRGAVYLRGAGLRAAGLGGCARRSALHATCSAAGTRLSPSPAGESATCNCCHPLGYPTGPICRHQPLTSLLAPCPPTPRSRLRAGRSQLAPTKAGFGGCEVTRFQKRSLETIMQKYKHKVRHSRALEGTPVSQPACLPAGQASSALSKFPSFPLLPVLCVSTGQGGLQRQGIQRGL